MARLLQASVTLVLPGDRLALMANLAAKLTIENVFKDLKAEERKRKGIKTRDEQTLEFRMVRPRQFKYRISKVRINADEKLTGCFMHFIVGGITREVTTDEIIKKLVKRKWKESKDAPEVEIETEKEYPRKEIEAIKPVAGHHFTWCKNVDPQKDILFDGEWTGFWNGTYRDLKREFLTVQVLTYELYGPNPVLGQKKVMLKDIAEGNVSVDVDIFRKNRLFVGAVTLMFEMEEVFEFKLDFKDWAVLSTLGDNTVSEEKFVVMVAAMKYQSGTPLLYDSMLNCFYKYPFRGRSPSIASPFGLICPTGATPLISNVLPIFDPVFHSVTVSIGGQKESNSAAAAKDSTEVHQMLHFSGTRPELEQESLEIIVQERIHPLFDRRSTYGTIASMQGVLDYGTLTTPLLVRGDASMFDFLNPAKPDDDFVKKIIKCFCRTLCCCRVCFSDPEVRSGLELRGNISFYRNAKPLYRQAGRAGADQMSPSADGENFIKCKIFNARNLHTLDGSYRSSINPSISVEWAGLIRETQKKMDTVMPKFDEVLEFRVASVENHIPTTVIVQAWHNDGFSKISLGVAVMDLGLLAQSLVEGVKEEELLTKDPPAKLFKFDVKLLPAGDAFAQKAEADKAVGGTAVVIDESKQQSDEQKEEAAKKKDKTDGSVAPADLTVQIYLDFEVFSVLKIQEKQRIASQKVEVDSPLFVNAFRAWQQAVRHVRTKKDDRFFLAYGRDEGEQKNQYLPTFISPQAPPFDLVNELKGDTPVRRPLRDIMEHTFNFVCSMECGRKPLNDQLTAITDILYDTNADVDEKRVAQSKLESMKILPGADFEFEPPVADWADPFQFMLKGMGDFKDHATLLCNFFIGLGVDAYVCVGKAKRSANQAQSRQPHVWVMTIYRTKEKAQPRRQFVTFWEIADGKPYELDEIVEIVPGESEDDKEAKRRMAEMAAKKAEEDAARAAKSKKKDNDAEAVAAEAAAAEAAAKKAAGPSEEELREAKLELAKRGRDEKVFKHDDQGVLDEEGESDALVEEIKLLQQPASSDADVVPGASSMMTPDAGLDAISAALAEPEAGSSDAKVDIFQAKEDAEKEMKKQRRVTERLRVKLLDVLYFAEKKPKEQLALDKMFESQPRQDRIKANGGSRGKCDALRIPYASLDVVFNHKQLYANLQHPDPTRCSFEFTDPSRWCAFPLDSDVSIPFYPSKSMRPAATNKELRNINDNIKEILASNWEKVRQNDFGLYTQFYDSEGDLRERLQIEEEFGIYRLPDVVNVDDDALEPMWKVNYANNAILEAKRKAWLDKVLAKLPEGCQYKERLLFFRHCDPLRITESVLAQCKDFLTTPEYLNPFFAFAVRAQRLPASVTPTRVLLVLVSYDPDSVTR